MIPEASGLAEKLGVNMQTVSTDPKVAFPTLFRPMTEEQLGVMQRYIDRGYDRFVKRVAKGRNLPESKVRAIAEGRVWDGVKAKSIGLVDELGGLEDAISLDCKTGKARRQLRRGFIPRPPRRSGRILPSASSAAFYEAVAKSISPATDAKIAAHAMEVISRKPVQARMLPLDPQSGTDVIRNHYGNEDDKDKLLTYVLTPLSWIYGACVYLRNKMFDANILKQKEFDIPVVSVGNITVGGTGKTPRVEYIVSRLSGSFNIGVLSRGYKRKTRGFIMANSKSSRNSIGDEPYQIWHKFGGVVKVAVCEKRTEGIRELSRLHPELDLIVLDDAFQHRYVKPKVSILLIDYNRPVFTDKLLPLGRLRESIHAVGRADMVIVTKCPDDIQPLNYRIMSNNLELMAFRNFISHAIAMNPLSRYFRMNHRILPACRNCRKETLCFAYRNSASPLFRKAFSPYKFKVKSQSFSRPSLTSQGETSSRLKESLKRCRANEN